MPEFSEIASVVLCVAVMGVLPASQHPINPSTMKKSRSASFSIFNNIVFQSAKHS